MIEDFIRVWPNKMPKDMCEEIIQAFESILATPELGDTVTDNSKQFNSMLARRDLSIYLEDDRYNQLPLVDRHLNCIHECLLEYITEFSQLNVIPLSNYANIKVQRTMPLGGYHEWHFENGNARYSHSRQVTWMVYLNDMPDGEAETEFLFQKRRIKPTQGTVVLWPAAMTHVHRGNPVYTQPKYITTGWWYNTRDDS